MQSESSSLDGVTAASQDTRRGVARWLTREIVGTLFVGVLLFGVSGRLDWIGAWALVALYAVWVTANAVLLIPRSPELLAERARRRAPGTKSWDTVILGIFGLLSLAKMVLAGLDVRFGWTRSFPVWLQVAGFVVAGLGYALVTGSMLTNAYFALTVRLQEERGQTVVTNGPYRTVRHPGYVGSMAFELGSALLLGSWWALVAGGLGALLMVVRTALEDGTLQRELDGYREYAARVRFRLLPGVW